MKNRSVSKPKAPGFVLAIALVTIVLLSIMAVTYLTSSTLERNTSRALANKTVAEMAAYSAANVAIARLVDNLSNYSDSATSWEVVTDTNGNLQYQGTVLYYREQSPDDVTATRPIALHALPLISGAESVTIPPPPQTQAGRQATLRAALPVLDDSNSFDLNQARFPGDTHGTIGAPSGTARPAFRGLWMNMPDSSGRIAGRCAYWMEDESFKANVNLMGTTPRGSNSPGASPVEIPLQGLLRIVLPGANPYRLANDIATFRSLFPNGFLEERDLNQLNNQSTLAESSKFEATIHSGALNLSRSGAKRVNLNSVVTTSTTATDIRKQLDEIIAAIDFNAPNFGQRSYRLGRDLNSFDVPQTYSDPHRTIYLNKIAANIRDYIDSDSQPTIVNNDQPAYSVQIGSAPAHSVPGGGAGGANEVIAIGKEAVPFIEEYMLRVKQLVFSNRLGESANYKLEIDHYLEFWNMTNRDITVASLGPNPFVRIANQFGWDSGGGDDIPEDPGS